jgi:predicted signal transduction protein with EAL and GGDEF domain
VPAHALAREAIRSLSMPYLLADIPVVIGASAGLLIEHGPLPGDAHPQLLREVDCALYTAKRAGGGSCTWAHPEAPLRRAG